MSAFNVKWHRCHLTCSMSFYSSHNAVGSESSIRVTNFNAIIQRTERGSCVVLWPYSNSLAILKGGVSV
jgi:hypothetical protein